MHKPQEAAGAVFNFAKREFREHPITTLPAFAGGLLLLKALDVPLQRLEDSASAYLHERWQDFRQRHQAPPQPPVQQVSEVQA